MTVVLLLLLIVVDDKIDDVETLASQHCATVDVSRSVVHNREPYKTGLTDQDLDSSGSKEPYIV